MKKVLSILLALMLAFSPLNIAFADEQTEEISQEQIQQEHSEEQSEESEQQAEEQQTEFAEEAAKEPQIELIKESVEESETRQTEENSPEGIKITMIGYDSIPEFSIHPDWDTENLFSGINSFEFYGVADGKMILLPILWDNGSSTLSAEDFEYESDNVIEKEYIFCGTLQAPDGYFFAPSVEERRNIQMSVNVSAETEPTQLYWSDSAEFYLKNGYNYPQNTTIEAIKANLNTCKWIFVDGSGFDTVNLKGETIYPVIDWENADFSAVNTAGATNGEPYMVTGVAVSFSEGTDNEAFILPDGKAEIEFPIHIRNSAKAELYLDAPTDPTYYQIRAYCPQDASGDFMLLYSYCGENMPTASQLDATQDFATDSSFIDYSNGCFDVWGLPDGEGWYAFYAQMGDYTSDYLLIDSRDNTACGHVDGSRDGDKNGFFPDIEQDAPETDDSDDSSDDNDDYDDSDDDHEQDTVSSGGSSVVSTIIVNESAPVEYENENGMALSGVRINTFAQIGESLVMSKNGVSLAVSPNELQRLGLSDNDLFAVFLTRPDMNSVNLAVNMNDEVPSYIPEMQVVFSNMPFEQGKTYTAMHQSGIAVSCYEVNGHAAFLAEHLGEYTIVISESVQETEPQAEPAEQSSAPEYAKSSEDSQNQTPDSAQQGGEMLFISRKMTEILPAILAWHFWRIW